MPIYEFYCSVCETYFERLKKVNERDDEVHCGRKAFRLLPTGVSLRSSDLESGMNPQGKDIQKRYIRTDGSVGRKDDKYYEACLKDKAKGIQPRTHYYPDERRKKK